MNTILLAMATDLGQELNSWCWWMYPTISSWATIMGYLMLDNN